MAEEFESLADRAKHYRQLATVIRARVATMKTPEARDVLEAVATDYELLASYTESLESAGHPCNTGPDE